MKSIQLLILISVISITKSKLTTESTHAILKRLGFDLVQRTPVNHHNKRVALETNKARYHNDFYNSNSDSRMFVVKLPPHSPYYSHMKPEKFKNEASSKPATSFRTNGKPGQIYHWNIPVLKKMPQAKKGIVRNANEDSKIYHIKILPNQTPSKYSRQDIHKKNKHKNKYEDKSDNGFKVIKYHRNKLYRFNDYGLNDTNVNSLHVESDSPIQNISITERHGGNRFQENTKNNNYINKKLNQKYVNEVSKIKNKNHGPNYYVPAIPKQNSFYKYFTGNGKPKSFYVIEKSKRPSRLHRLL